MSKKENVKDEEKEVVVENESEEQQSTEEQAEKAVKPLDPLEKAEIELQEQKDKFLRLYAEFENFKRRTAKERIELIKTAGQDIILDLLPVIDDLDRAEKAITNEESIEAYKTGFQLIKDKLYKTLENKGLKAEEAIEQDFDPDFHEAITEIDAPGKNMKGKVVDVIEKGYTLNGKIIRYAKVVIGK